MNSSLNQAARDFIVGLKDVEVPKGDIRNEMLARKEPVKGYAAILKALATYVTRNEDVEFETSAICNILGDKDMRKLPLAALIEQTAQTERPNFDMIDALKLPWGKNTIDELGQAVSNIHESITNGGESGHSDFDNYIKQQAHEYDPTIPAPAKADERAKEANGYLVAYSKLETIYKDTLGEAMHPYTQTRSYRARD